jgi:hypothetical protein
MNIALAQSEIAQFLEFSLQEVVGLWERRILKRSIHVDQRSNPELSHSSVFDVLEFYVRNEVLNGEDPGTEVEAWLCAVDELVESRTWDGRTFEDMVFELIQFYHDFSGNPCTPHEAASRASQVLAAYFNLLRFVQPQTSSDLQRARAC